MNKINGTTSLIVVNLYIIIFDEYHTKLLESLIFITYNLQLLKFEKTFFIKIRLKFNFQKYKILTCWKRYSVKSILSANQIHTHVLENKLVDMARQEQVLNDVKISYKLTYCKYVK